MPHKTKRRPSMSRRLKLVMVACLAVATVLALGAMFVAQQERLARGAAEAASYTPAPVANATKDTRPVALFIGDSYSVGTGATVEANRWTSLVAEELGWSEVNRANGGTGYLATAGMAGCGREACPNYQGVLPDLSDMAPDYVFIAGGQNDFRAYGEDPSEVLSSVEETYTAYRAAFPDAQLVAVGPSTTGDSASRAAVEMDQAVQNAAAKVDAQYISLLEPNVIEPEMVTEDGGHVTDEGHAAIATRVINALG